MLKQCVFINLNFLVSFHLKHVSFIYDENIQNHLFCYFELYAIILLIIIIPYTIRKGSFFLPCGYDFVPLLSLPFYLLVTTIMFYIFMSSIFLDYTYEWYHMAFSLSGPDLFHLTGTYMITNIRFLPFICSIILHFIYNIYYILHIHSSVNGYFSWFCVLEIVNNTSVNMNLLVHLWCTDFISFEYVPRSRLAELHGSSISEYFPLLFLTVVVLI